MRMLYNFVCLCHMLEVLTRFEQRRELWFCPRLSLKGQDFYFLFWSDWLITEYPSEELSV